MYLNILKRDLKRNRTMNIILLLFVILAAMFVASGLNNVVTILNGTDYFFEKAGLLDYMVFTQFGDGGVGNILEHSKQVKNFREEYCIWGSNDDVTIKGKKLITKNNNTLVLQPLEEDQLHFFLADNTRLRKVKQGEVYVTSGILDKNHAKVGDILRIQLQDVDLSLQIAGEIKDALLGSDMMGNTRLVMNSEDYQVFASSEKVKPYEGRIFHVATDDTKALASELTRVSNILFSSDRSMIKMAYVMDMIVAMIVLVLSICLIIVSFVVLRFVIAFTIQGEYREIGVMKAIGIKNSRIRRLYIVKYCVMACVGGVIGFFVSIPFGNMLIASVSTKMVLGNDNGHGIHAIGTMLVIVLMVWVAYLCTGNVKKLTPVDAIRSGQTGERYQKKSGYRLCHSHVQTPFYMAVNDVLSAPRRYLTIWLAFLLCSIFMLGIVLVSSTVRSKNLITCFGKESDIYIPDAKLIKMNVMTDDGKEQLKENYRSMEKDLEEKGIPGKVSMEVWYKYSCEVDGEAYSVIFQQNTETKASEYSYTEGTAPQNANEIAITPAIGEQLGVGIGDTITIDFGTEKRKCMVTAMFQSMNQLGKVARLHEDAPTSMSYASAMMAYQIDFADHPDEKEIIERIQTIKKMYGISGIYDAAGYCVDCMRVADTMDSVVVLLLIITGIVVILVTMLMERSFISAEFGQIALLKAIGFTNRSVWKWHVCRFLLVAALAECSAVVLTVPVTKLWCDPIWAMMGATDVHYYFDPIKILLIYPGIILGITLVTIGISAWKTCAIKGADLVNVE